MRFPDCLDSSAGKPVGAGGCFVGLFLLAMLVITVFVIARAL